MSMPTIAPNGTEAASVAEIARQSVQPVLQNSEVLARIGAPLVIWPNSQRVEKLENLLPAPLAKRGAFAAGTADSFAAYVSDHKTPGTIITGEVTEKTGSFRAILDYHTPGSHEAGWGSHTASLTLEQTPQWARWLAADRKEFSQREFGEFIEENAPDVVVPEGDAGKGFPTQADLLSVALSIQAKSDIRFTSGVRLSNGQQQLTYVEDITAGAGIEGKMAIPERFALGIAPYRGTDKYLVIARLRYRLGGGKVVFRYEIERAFQIVEDAWLGLRKLIETKTGLVVRVGKIGSSAP